MNPNMDMIPAKYQKDINRAVEILKEEGCTDIYIFGSLVNGNSNEHSDIDFAVNGLPENKYFKVMGKLMFELENPFDLVDLDEKENRFIKAISKGELVKIATNH